MRDISSQAQAALLSGRCRIRTLLKASPDGDDPFCIWDDNGSISFGGDVYVGKPRRFTIESSGSSADFSIRNLTVNLSGIDPQAVALVDGAQWSQRPILVQRAIIAIDQPKVLNIIPEFAGFMDQIEWDEDVDGMSILKLTCESTSREYSRVGTRTTSDADQRERDSSDGILSFAQSAVSTTIDWGAAPQAPPKQHSSGGIAGFLSKIF